MTSGESDEAVARPPDRRPGTLDVAAFVIAIAISAIVLFVPSTGGLPIFPYADKLVHGSVFGVLALTGSRANARAALLAPLLVAYAIGSEVIQATLLPERSGDITDVVADCCGIALGLLAARLISRWRR